MKELNLNWSKAWTLKRRIHQASMQSILGGHSVHDVETWNSHRANITDKMSMLSIIIFRVPSRSLPPLVLPGRQKKSFDIQLSIQVHPTFIIHSLRPRLVIHYCSEDWLSVRVRDLTISSQSTILCVVCRSTSTRPFGCEVLRAAYSVMLSYTLSGVKSIIPWVITFYFKRDPSH